MDDDYDPFDPNPIDHLSYAAVDGCLRGVIVSIVVAVLGILGLIVYVSWPPMPGVTP